MVPTWNTAGGPPHLADVFDTRLHQPIVLGEGGSFSIVCFTVVNVTSTFAAYLHLREKDPGGKVFVVQEGNRADIFHQISLFCLQIHKTWRGGGQQRGEGWFSVCV